MGHRPMYCSNGNHGGACLTEDTFHRNGTLDGVKVGLEEIFHDNKVDLCLSGHEHSYGTYLNVTVYARYIDFSLKGFKFEKFQFRFLFCFKPYHLLFLEMPHFQDDSVLEMPHFSHYQNQMGEMDKNHIESGVFQGTSRTTD